MLLQTCNYNCLWGWNRADPWAMLGQSRYSFPSPWLTCTKPFAASQLLWSRSPGWWKAQNQAQQQGMTTETAAAAATSGNRCESGTGRMSPGENVGRRAAAPTLEQQRREQGNASPPKSPCTLFLGAESSDGRRGFQEVDVSWRAGLWLKPNLVLEKHFYACRD